MIRDRDDHDNNEYNNCFKWIGGFYRRDLRCIGIVDIRVMYPHELAGPCPRRMVAAHNDCDMRSTVNRTSIVYSHALKFSERQRGEVGDGTLTLLLSRLCRINKTTLTLVHFNLTFRVGGIDCGISFTKRDAFS